MGIEHRIPERGPCRLFAIELAALSIAALCGGCTVGPNYRRPDTQVPKAWSAASAPGASSVESRPVTRAFDGRRWWSVFKDPVLDGVIDEAMRQNLDLQTAALRIAEARAQRDVTAGAELPSVGATGLAGRSRMSENGFTSTLGAGPSSSSSDSGSGARSGSSSPPSPTANLFQVGFDALWELDLWGKTRRSVEAANALTESAEQARGEAAVSLAAEVARTYLALRGMQRQLAIADADVTVQERLLALVESSARYGLVPRSDMAQQAAQLAGARAQIPAIAQNIEQATDRLALLLALPPGALRERVGPAPRSDAGLPPEVPIGLPGDLLRRRPDVMRSEAELHAATARVGAAQAQLFPSIEIGAVAGLQATHAHDLTDWGSRFFVGGAQISVPVFQGGRLRAQTHVADTQMQEAAIAYRETVLGAYHDANAALVAYFQEQRHASALARQVAQARRSRDFAQARYQSGLAPLIEALEANRIAHQAELAALQSNVTATTNLVALYKALGGDWTAPTAP
jgi:NodT family efflux transporter outer membrane factor (OMF) lipoprotein